MNNRRIIGILDPSMSSDNMGDHIIQDAVRAELADAFPDWELVALPTQRTLTLSEMYSARACQHFFVGGTNILNGNLPFYRQWKLDPLIVSILRGRTSPMGVGWWKYQDKTNALSAWTWRTLFGHNPVSVRDSYTRSKVEQLGSRAINTSCPTMWRLPDVVNSSSSVSDTVVVTLTDYRRSVDFDVAMFEALRSIYKYVYLWPQGEKDRDYVERLRLEVTIGPREVSWFDEMLLGGVDYVGTRLHAGVRAHQLRAHSMIVAIDNRAVEISHDTGLPIVMRHDFRKYADAFAARTPVRLHLPKTEIEDWKKQTLGIVHAL